MAPLLALLALLPALASAQHARTFTVRNSCSQTLWPSFAGSAKLDQPSIWELGAGQTTVFNVPDNYPGMRLWARTGCVASASSSNGLKCTSGDDLPSTLAEFTLSTTGSWTLDFYDISLVDGFNVPIAITPSRTDCHAPKCAANINAICPPQMRSHVDSDGVNHACAGACLSGFGDELWGNRDCCTGAYGADAALCGISGVDFYHVFKDNCPDSYAYAYDEQSGAALYACDTKQGAPDYDIEFCPGNADFTGVVNAPLKYANDFASVHNKATTWSQSFTIRPSPTLPAGVSAPTAAATTAAASSSAVATPSAVPVPSAAPTSDAAASTAAAAPSEIASSAVSDASPAVPTSVVVVPTAAPSDVPVSAPAAPAASDAASPASVIIGTPVASDAPSVRVSSAAASAADSDAPAATSDSPVAAVSDAPAAASGSPVVTASDAPAIASEAPVVAASGAAATAASDTPVVAASDSPVLAAASGSPAAAAASVIAGATTASAAGGVAAPAQSKPATSHAHKHHKCHSRPARLTARAKF
ncbi:Thaumatin-like protein 1 [Vanrija pseudolonga]|uniref:Thaumatin-like protein 1 n=1 Tax=Vanrija pseudolonga TaxID=143232 RepID=A0AAF1BL17_9TREE|nr:Thaumatin-like protein 1 [Vanrija pseudolonga]